MLDTGIDVPEVLNLVFFKKVFTLFRSTALSRSRKAKPSALAWQICFGSNSERLFSQGAGYRFLVYKHYLILYLTNPDEKTVYIHAVFNEKLDYFRYMRKRI